MTLRRIVVRYCVFAMLLAEFSIPIAAGQAVDPAIQTGVRELLQQYSSAFERLDPNAVKKVQPSADVENLRNAFKEMRALAITIDEIKILSTDSAITRAGCRVTQTMTPKAGSKKTIVVMRVIRLRRQGTAWIIDAFER